MAKPLIIALMLDRTRTHARNKGLLLGVAKYSRMHGPWRFRSSPLSSINEASKSLDWIRKTKPDGMIVSGMGDEEMVQRALELNIPIVVHGLSIFYENYHCLTTNNYKIGQMGAEHFIERGFKHFAFFGYNDLFWSNDRKKGFVDRIVEVGYDVQIYGSDKGDCQEDKHLSIEDWLISLPRPVGLMTANDDCSYVIAEACMDLNIAVPNKISILGVDNDNMICELSNPPLSSIRLDAQKAGFEAAELLDRAIAGKAEKPETIIMQPLDIVIRESTGFLAVNDEHVIKALLFIKNNSKQAIQVNDVVDVVPISRRSLEQRFRKLLKRSIFDEIQNIRVKNVRTMLIESNLPIGKIAVALNYSSIEHISRSFKREVGLSPVKYRKRYQS